MSQVIALPDRDRPDALAELAAQIIELQNLAMAHATVVVRHAEELGRLTNHLAQVEREMSRVRTQVIELTEQLRETR